MSYVEPGIALRAFAPDSIPAFKERLSRIYVRFRPHGTDTSFLALLDTGGHFCILSREVAKSIRGQLDDPFDSTELRTASPPAAAQSPPPSSSSAARRATAAVAPVNTPK